MKLLLLLLVFPLSSANTSFVCGPGFAANDIKNISPIRTDWCNPDTKKSELFECHLQNRTIRGNVDIEEHRDGKKYITRCVADGEKGIHVTSRAILDNMNENSTDVPTTPSNAPETTTNEHSSHGCSHHEDAGNEWIEGEFVKACQYLEGMNGRRFLSTIIIRCIIDGEEIPVGKDKRYPDGSVSKCERRGRTEADVFELAGGVTNFVCKMGRRMEPRKLGEEWEEHSDGEGFVKTCVRNKKNEAVVAIKACIHPKTGEHIPVDEYKRDKKSGRAECFRMDRNEPVLKAKLALNATHFVPALPCKNGKSIREEWIEGKFVIECKYIVDGKGRKIGTEVAVRCISPEGDQVVVGGQLRYPDGSVLGCVRRGETEADLAELPEGVDMPQCNGNKIGDDWEVHSSTNQGRVMTCALDSTGVKVIALKAIVVVKACIYDRVIIPVGESKDVPEGHCQCVSDQAEGAPVLSVGVRCLSNPPYFVQSTTPTIAPETTTTIIPETPGEPSRYNENLCNSGKMEFDVERVDGNYVMVCKNTTVRILKKDIISMVYAAVRCITPLGDQVPVGEKKIRGGAVFKCRGEYSFAKLLVTPLDANATCENGQKLGESRLENDVERICNWDLLVEARFCVFTHNNVPGYIPIGHAFTHPLLDSYYICEKRGELDAVFVKKTATEMCSDGDVTFESKAPRTQIPPWTKGGFVEACVQLDDGKYQVVSVGCLTPEGDAVRVGENKSYESGKSYTCEKVGEYEAVLRHHQKIVTPDPLLCANGLRVNNFTTEGYIIRMVNKNCVKQAVHCYVKNIVKKYIEIGETIREDFVQYSCQKKGDLDAEMVIKPFAQLCEEGDSTVNAWISEQVLRDCDRRTDKPTVHARMCVLNDKRIIEIGQSIKEEFETYNCQRVGEFDAFLDVDMSRIHAAYFTTPGVCKNGKKIGEEWTEKGYARRACHDHKGKAVVVEIGCVLSDGRILPVGTQEKKKDANAPADRLVIRTIRCEAMTPYGISMDSLTSDTSRECMNGKDKVYQEGKEWEHENVLRTCKEVDDKMRIVALRCVFGNNETLEIGQIKETSDVSSIECVRVGDNDAATRIDLVSPEGIVCENGKKFNEHWKDGDIVRACRIRRRRPTLVAIGCLLDDGFLLYPGENDYAENAKPGYAHSRVFTHCAKVGDYDAKKIVTNEEAIAGDCGGKELGDVWATGRFIKKCKIVESEVDKDGKAVNPHGEHAVVTIGCISRKGTHVLEGQAVEEEDLHITCHRNEDGRMTIRYSFTVKEE